MSAARVAPNHGGGEGEVGQAAGEAVSPDPSASASGSGGSVAASSSSSCLASMASMSSSPAASSSSAGLALGLGAPLPSPGGQVARPPLAPGSPSLQPSTAARAALLEEAAGAAEALEPRPRVSGSASAVAAAVGGVATDGSDEAEEGPSSSSSAFASASAPSQGSGSRKRSPDDLSLLCELPPREAEAVGLALEQWGRLRLRVKALEPTLRREGALVQEILDTGLRDENRRTLRKLTQSSAGGDVEETIQQVGKAIGANRERLERILERNHGELVRLSTTAVSDMKEDVLREVDEVLARLKHALAAVRGELLGAKERADMTAVRRTGRSFNDLKGLVRRLDEERRLITRNSALAALLVTVCRRVLPVRQVDPAALRDIPASCEGYRRIMDFYFFTDAGLYFFGDYPSGPNWFVRLKRNVAILLVRDAGGRTLYNHFAVSGEHRAPGAPLAPDGGPLRSMEAKDEHGRVFNRQHDAEFKLLSGFCTMAAQASASLVGATGTLWSRKPLCASCLGAVRQVRGMFPQLDLAVSVGALSSSENGANCADASRETTAACCTDSAREVEPAGYADSARGTTAAGCADSARESPASGCPDSTRELVAAGCVGSARGPAAADGCTDSEREPAVC